MLKKELGKLIVAKGIKKLPKVQQIVQSGHMVIGKSEAGKQKKREKDKSRIWGRRENHFFSLLKFYLIPFFSQQASVSWFVKHASGQSEAVKGDLA